MLLYSLVGKTDRIVFTEVDVTIFSAKYFVLYRINIIEPLIFFISFTFNQPVQIQISRYENDDDENVRSARNSRRTKFACIIFGECVCVFACCSIVFRVYMSARLFWCV